MTFDRLLRMALKRIIRHGLRRTRAEGRASKGQGGSTLQRRVRAIRRPR